MIQVYGKAILSMKFKFIIKAHGLKPWQFIYQNLNSHWQDQKPNSHWQYIKSLIFIGNISKTQLSLVISKAQFTLAISKTQFMLAILKAQANYLALFSKKPKVINTW